MQDIPSIPECSVEYRDGLFHLTHRATRKTATAETLEQVELQGMHLRIAAALQDAS